VKQCKVAAKTDTDPPMSTGRNVREAPFKATCVKLTKAVKLSGSLQSHTQHTRAHIILTQ